MVNAETRLAALSQKWGSEAERVKAPPESAVPREVEGGGKGFFRMGKSKAIDTWGREANSRLEMLSTMAMMCLATFTWSKGF